jgi:putative nucleotidyltransferase with HDIG domain
MPMLYVMPKDANRLLSRMQDVPPIPAVASRIMTMVQDKRTSFQDLAQVVSTDQGLTARLIRLANSAEYAFGRRCGTVKDAIQLLGFLQVRQIAISSSLMGMFRGPDHGDISFDPDLFWSHSLTVAVAAEGVAASTHLARPDDAFTAGILHDIGRLVIRQALPEEFHAAGRLMLETGLPLEQAEIETTGYAHEQVGRALGRRWKFPAPLVTAIASHHNENLTPEVDGLAGIIAQCNRLAHAHGLTCGYVAGPGEPRLIPPDLARIEELAGGMEAVLRRAYWFIEATLGDRRMTA